jgi:hypothetical protein
MKIVILENELALFYLQKLTNSTYPEPHESTSSLISYLYVLLLYSHECLGLRSGQFHAGSDGNTLGSSNNMTVLKQN